MSSIVWWLVQDFVSILALVMLVYVACFALRNRPAWRHALWLVVLVKFLTPPVVSWPWSLEEVVDRVIPAASLAGNAEEEILLTPKRSSAAEGPAHDWSAGGRPLHSAEEAIAGRIGKQQNRVYEEGDINASTSILTVLNEPGFKLAGRVFMGIWIAGSALTLLVQLRRLRRRELIVRQGTPAPPFLVREVERASRKMNIPPLATIVAAAAVSPFLWCVGRLRLVWPKSLLDQDGINRSRGIIAHELAHVRRRDHWIAWLELAAGVIWWWNPVFWFVRRRLRESAETACDAIALSVYDNRREYAEMFLELSSQVETETPAPVLGVSSGSRSSFERRLAMMLDDRVSGKLSLWGILLGACLTAVSVPGWSLAQNSTISNAAAPTHHATVATKNIGLTSPDTESTASGDDRSSGAAKQTLSDLPKNETARLLLERWRKLEDRATPLHNLTIHRLRYAIKKRARKAPTRAAEASLMRLREWEYERDEHPAGEVAQWLDRVAEIYEGPLQFALRNERRVGSALSKERMTSLRFGPAAKNGLRAAWSHAPVRDHYAIGDVVTSTLVIQNTADRPIEFEFLDDFFFVARMQATADSGREIKCSVAWYSGVAALFKCRLKPGEVIGYGRRRTVIGEGEKASVVLPARSGERVTVRWKLSAPVPMTTGPVSFNVVARSVAAPDPGKSDAKGKQPQSRNASKPKFIVRGREALDFIAKHKPAWSEPQQGIQFGVTLVGKKREFHAGEKVPLALFLRNVAEMPAKVSLALDFLAHPPDVRDHQGKSIPIEPEKLFGAYARWRATLAPGEIVGFRHAGLALGKNPTPGEVDWHPAWQNPIQGAFDLRQTKAINVDGRPLTFTTGALQFAIAAKTKTAK